MTTAYSSSVGLDADDSSNAPPPPPSADPMTPMSKKTLEYIRIEIQRAEDEDDEAMAGELRKQYARLERGKTKKRSSSSVSPVRSLIAPMSSSSLSDDASDSAAQQFDKTLSTSLPSSSSSSLSSPLTTSQQSEGGWSSQSVSRNATAATSSSSLGSSSSSDSSSPPRPPSASLSATTSAARRDDCSGGGGGGGGGGGAESSAAPSPSSTASSPVVGAPNARQTTTSTFPVSTSQEAAASSVGDDQSDPTGGNAGGNLNSREAENEPEGDLGGLILEEHSNKVVDRLYIGDLSAATEPALVKALGITHVVDLANTIDDHVYTLGKSSKNVSYVVSREVGDWKLSSPSIESKLVVRVDDTNEAPLADHFEAINNFVNQALYGQDSLFDTQSSTESGSADTTESNGVEGSGGGGGGGGSAHNNRVLVHCFRGKSRSAAAVIQYLMQFGPTVKDLETLHLASAGDEALLGARVGECASPASGGGGGGGGGGGKEKGAADENGGGSRKAQHQRQQQQQEGQQQEGQQQQQQQKEEEEEEEEGEEEQQREFRRRRRLEEVQVERRMTLKQALEAVKTARPVIQLNVGFRKLLMDLEATLRPGEPPSVVLKMKSSKPVLSSGRRKSATAAALAAAATATAATDTAAAAKNPVDISS